MAPPTADEINAKFGSRISGLPSGLPTGMPGRSTAPPCCHPVESAIRQQAHDDCKGTLCPLLSGVLTRIMSGVTLINYRAPPEHLVQLQQGLGNGVWQGCPAGPPPPPAP